jgi:tetratricopeptide (TPR) repeat protein
LRRDRARCRLALVGACATLVISCGPPGPPRGPQAPDLAALRDAARRQAENGEARAVRDLGWLELLTGGPEAATAAFDRALRQAPDDPAALLGAALVRDDDGDFAAARPLWLRLLRALAARPVDAALAPAAEVAVAALAGSAEEIPGEGGLATALGDLPLDRLPPEARRGALELRARVLRRRGAEDKAVVIDAALGCAPRWKVVGPYGTLAHLELGRRFPPDDAAWRGAIDTRPGGRPLELRDAPGRGCRVAVESQTGRAGVMYALTQVEMRARAEVLLTVASEVDLLVLVDGVTVLRRDDPTRYQPRRMAVRFELPAGSHRLVVKLGSTGQRGEARIYLTTPGGLPVPGLAFADPLAGRGGAAAPQRVEPVAPPEPLPPRAPPSGLVDLYLAAAAAYLAGDGDRTDALVGRLLQSAPGFVSGLLLRAESALADPGRPAAVTLATARAALLKVLAVAPRSAGALVELARLDQHEERPRDALQRLEQARALRPERARIDLMRSEVLEGRGWDREAELALDEAERKHPESCRLLEARVSVLHKRRDGPGLVKLARRLRACNAESEHPAQSLREADDLGGAVAEYRRLLALDPQREQVRSDLAEVLLQTGDAAGAAHELRLLVRAHPRRASYRVRLADALLAGGDPAAARRALHDGIAHTPEAAELHRALEALGLPGALDRWRLDGRTVIADFEKAGRRYADPAVYLLDRTVTRVFPGGARLTLTHNIIKVLTKEGAEHSGEVHVPENADVLLLRTVKRDRTTREPEEVAGKRTVSVPDLEVGDYVEMEYVVPEEPLPAFPGGFLAERFFFRSFEAPLDRTEYVVVTPAGMALTIDARNGAPRAEERTADGLTIREWRRRGVRQAVPEPLAPPAVETLPSVRVGAGVTHVGFRDAVREQIYGLTRANAELRALATRLCGKAPTQRDCARAVHGFVVKHIQPGDGGGATAALAQRQGNRLILSATLLREAGLRVEPWLVKSRTQAVDPVPGSPAPLEVADFADTVLRAEADGQPLFLDPRGRRSPFAYLGPALRGALGMRLAGDGPLFATVPSRGVGQDLRVVELTVALRPDGSARVRARERLTGIGAQEWRESLDQMPGDQINKEFEQRWLGYFFAGATLDRLAVEGRGDPSQELVLAYDFTLARLGRRTGQRVSLPVAFFALELAKRYVAVAQREYPLVVLEHPPTELRVTVELPAGARATVPAAVVLSSDFGRFAWRGRVAGDRVTLERRSAVPLGRVAPAAYRSFVGFAAAVDQTEAREVEIALP